MNKLKVGQCYADGEEEATLPVLFISRSFMVKTAIPHTGEYEDREIMSALGVFWLPSAYQHVGYSPKPLSLGVSKRPIPVGVPQHFMSRRSLFIESS